MKKILFCLLIVLTVFSCSKKETEEVKKDKPVTIEMWTKEGDADGSLQWTKDLIAEFMTKNPLIKVELVKKENVETLREDFLTASLAGDVPDLLWTVSDHAGPFLTADLIQPVDDYIDLNKYVETVTADGKAWAVPMSSGNHLMLIYNKELVPNPPKSVDELIEIGKEISKGDNYGLVYNQTEPFWLVPWLGGFNGKVFADDGVTPDLDNQAMIDTLKLLADLKNVHKITPNESDYNGADTLFKEGKAGMIINGDWSLGSYEEVFGEGFGATRIPMVNKTKSWPAPYTAGIYFMMPKDIPEEEAKAAGKLIEFFTSKDIQYRQVDEFNRFPGLKSAYDAPKLQDNDILKGSAYQLEVGTPMPTVNEMRAVWDAMKPEMAQVLAGNKSPEDAAKAMQESAIAGIEAQK